MEEQNQVQAQFNDNEESGFDFISWGMLFLHYWYLFVLFTILGFGAAYLKNKSWIENYRTEATIMIDEKRNSQGFMQGFSVQNGFSSLENQPILLNSYDLISRVVDSLPEMKIDYFSIGRFKTRNIYKHSPVKINAEYIDRRAYGILFQIEFLKDDSYIISDYNEVLNKKMKLKGRIGIPLQHSLFNLNVEKTAEYAPNRKIYFMFRSKESLIGDFYGRLNPNFVGGSSIISVSLQSQTPERDIDFINKLFDVFLYENLEQKNNQATKTINFVNKQLSSIKRLLLTSEKEIKDFRKENNIVNISNHTSDILSKATQYDELSSKLNHKKEYLDYLSEYISTNIDKGNIIAPASLYITDPMLISLISQFNEAIVKKNETSEKYPNYNARLRQIENIKKTINEIIRSMYTSIDIEQQDLNQKMVTLQDKINLLPAQESQMIALERRYKVDENYYNFFITKKVEAQVQKAANSPDNQIVDRARIVGVTNRGEKKQTTFTYVLIALLIPTLLLILKELLNNTIRGPKDVEKNSPFPLIGSVNHTKSNDPLIMLRHPRSVFAETFRVIRTKIEFITQHKSNITLLSTSAEPGDGKTYVNINLANVYAMTGKKTLLIDLDIRKPSIGKRLGIEEQDGVTNYLIREKELGELIIRKDDFKFDLLLGGTIPPNPSELMRSKRLHAMLQELKSIYDYIIIDTSPIGLVSDAYSLAATVTDINLLIVRDRKTNKSFFKEINEHIKSNQLKNFYIVLNDIDVESKDYKTYGQKYGYGYGYGYTNKNNTYTEYYSDSSEL